MNNQGSHYQRGTTGEQVRGYASSDQDMTERLQHSGKQCSRDEFQDALPVLPHIASRSIRRTVRRSQLREIVPLADTTIYEMEQRGEFPRRFHLTPRCVVWDLAEVEAWIEERRRASERGEIETAPPPDVRHRKKRPVSRQRWAR